jgi:hypothetical protein
MAKIRKGILGPVSGKIGPVVGGTWKGIPYIKTAPKPTKKKKKKRTPAQIAAQEKLKFMNLILVPFHPYITVGFANEAAQQTEISAAFSVNYYTMISGVYPALEADYSKLVLSLGKLPMVNGIEIGLHDPETLKLTWKDDTIKNAAFDDQLMLVAYAPELDRTFGFTGGVSRSQKQCTVKIEGSFVGKVLEVYLSMTSFNRKAVANSVYLGKIG